MAKVNYDRREVIEASWGREFKIPLDSNERNVARAALEQKDLKFSADWVVRSDEIITFHNLRDETLPLTAIIDPASADPLPVKRYIYTEEGELHIDRVNILKDLLRNTLRQQLHHRGIAWQHEERLFIFTGPEDKDIRKEEWAHGRKGGRTVYHKVRSDDQPDKIWFHEHVAFEASFDLYDGQWYLAVKPEWFCSYDGYNKSEYQHKNRVSYLKKMSFNSDVIDQLIFIVDILQKDQKESLLEYQKGPHIRMGELVQIDGALPINDDEWLQQEEKKRRKGLTKVMKGLDEIPLFEKHDETRDDT